MLMVASPADLPFGCLIVCDAHLSGPASHDGAGQRFVLIPTEHKAYAYALDVERRDLPAPEALAQALGPDAMKRWGEIEVIAKLLDLPAHIVLRAVLAGDGPALRWGQGIEMHRTDSLTHWRVIGRRTLYVAEGNG